ncbi:tol-pal system protein YbgF [candidate division WOR-3 bacterium]|nr:tol-pal system protein YbgF [candidate division WOR-3 bacterium]
MLLGAGRGLLAVVVLSGCSVQREYVRRGQLLDSLAARVNRMEQRQLDQDQQQARMRADLMTQFDLLDERFQQLSAQIIDMTQQVDRLGRRPARRPESPESLPGPDLTGLPDDTTGRREEQAYSTAYLDYMKGKYDLAITGFEDFIQRFPQSDNADNARYWVGECYYSMGRFDDAEREFRRVLVDWPDGNKASGAAYKLALVYLAQKRKPEALSQLRKVVKNYPGTSEARLAQDRLQSLE